MPGVPHPPTRANIEDCSYVGQQWLSNNAQAAIGDLKNQRRPSKDAAESNVHSSVVELWILAQRTWVRIQPRKINFSKVVTVELIVLFCVRLHRFRYPSSVKINGQIVALCKKAEADTI